MWLHGGWRIPAGKQRYGWPLNLVTSLPSLVENSGKRTPIKQPQCLIPFSSLTRHSTMTSKHKPEIFITISYFCSVFANSLCSFIFVIMNIVNGYYVMGDGSDTIMIPKLKLQQFITSCVSHVKRKQMWDIKLPGKWNDSISQTMCILVIFCFSYSYLESKLTCFNIKCVTFFTYGSV